MLLYLLLKNIFLCVYSSKISFNLRRLKLIDMKNYYCILTWIFAIIGILMILVAGIAYLIPGFGGVQYWYNVYYASQPLFVLAILLLLASRKECKKE